LRDTLRPPFVGVHEKSLAEFGYLFGYTAHEKRRVEHAVSQDDMFSQVQM
jgi:hypothetical protein